MSGIIEVDARRLLCPLPVIRLQDAVKQANPGDWVDIVCTDPGTMNDVPAWCRINGHQLNKSEQIAYEYFFRIRVAE